MSASESASTLVEGILQAVESFISPHQPINYCFDVRVPYTMAFGLITIPAIKQEHFVGWFAIALMPDAQTIVSIYIDEHRQGHLYTKNIAKHGVENHILMSRESLKHLPEDLPDNLLDKIHETLEKEPKFEFNA